ncbi:MAG TPA: hypothetical protein VIH45_07330 [Desulfuromonadaceae bacterium]
MSDQEQWDRAVKAAGSAYAQLPLETRGQLDGLIGQIMGIKEELVERTRAAGSASTCRTCAGQCCRNGKYHVSVLDLLAYCSSGTAPVVPDFGPGPVCPYSGESGCRMPPRFRPMTCVVFNCELIEDPMGPDERTALYAGEQRLRDAIARASRLTGQRLDRALLLSCDT